MVARVACDAERLSSIGDRACVAHAGVGPPTLIERVGGGLDRQVGGRLGLRVERAVAAGSTPEVVGHEIADYQPMAIADVP